MSLGDDDGSAFLNQLNKYTTVDHVTANHLDELLEKLPEPEDIQAEDVQGPALDKVKKENMVFKSISSYPFMLRDIAVWVPSDKTSNDVLEIIKKEAGELLVNTKLFDEFKKDDKVSYAFNLVFQSQEKTLSDEEVNKIMDAVTKALNNNPNWEVR